MTRTFSFLAVVVVCVGLIAALRSNAISTLLEEDTRQPGSLATVGTDHAGLRGLVVLPEDGGDAILDEIERARSSIDLYVYLLPAEEVLTSLSRAHERGVAVRVILERDPFGGGNSNQDAFDRLAAAGIDVRWSDDRFQFSHIKTFVVDQRVAAIMTLNLSRSALTRNREFAVITTIPTDVAELTSLFEADWSRQSFQPSGDLVTSPDNSRAAFRNLIESATESIEIYAEVVRDAKLRELLIAASEHGIAVRILVPTSPSGDDLLIYRELEAKGIQVKLLADAYSHAKAIIVDRETAFVGSQNLTLTSLDRNRECGIILKDQPNLARIGSVFQSDWEASARVD